MKRQVIINLEIPTDELEDRLLRMTANQAFSEAVLALLPESWSLDRINVGMP